MAHKCGQEKAIAGFTTFLFNRPVGMSVELSNAIGHVKDAVEKTWYVGCGAWGTLTCQAVAHKLEL